MNFIELIKKNFGKKILKIERPLKRRVYVEVSPEYIKKTVNFLFNQMKMRFSTATGIDEKDYMEILYHFSFDQEGTFVTLRAKLDIEKPEIDSISDVIIAAKWIEREMHELLGIYFKGNQDMGGFLLSQDYKGRKFPLRKS